MTAQGVLTHFQKVYPGKTILKLPDDNPTEIICEAEPSRYHPERSVAIAAIKSSAPHYHKESTEIYEVIEGHLDLYVDGELVRLFKGDSYTIHPGQIHYAKGEFTFVKTTSTPGWVFEDHILTNRIVIVNDQDEIIGHKERCTLVKEDIYRVSALWVTNSNGDILLAQRKFTKKHDPGKWGPAVAGTVDEGETYENNIIKEAEEEIGLANIKPTLGPKRRVYGEHNYFCQWYTLIVDKAVQDFTIQEEEVEQIRWIPKIELQKDLREHPDRYVSGMQWSVENL
jgi:isopentenyldiphosphate isomerase/mannose-6-phosphate isomerase-like protein (cupin superfamily)